MRQMGQVGARGTQLYGDVDGLFDVAFGRGDQSTTSVKPSLVASAHVYGSGGCPVVEQRSCLFQVGGVEASRRGLPCGLPPQLPLKDSSEFTPAPPLCGASQSFAADQARRSSVSDVSAYWTELVD